MARPTSLAALLVAVLTVLTTAGCGLRADERPQPIPRERLDNRLFVEGGEDTGGVLPAVIFVITLKDGATQLTEVPINVPFTSDRDRAVLEALLTWAPPGSSGGNPRLTSRIPNGTVLRNVRREGSVLYLDLSNFSIEGPGQVQALGQLVYTATALTGIDSVVFAIDGKRVAVPLEDRSSTPGERLDETDFPSLRPEPPPAPTTTLGPSSGTMTAPPSVPASAPARPAPGAA